MRFDKTWVAALVASVAWLGACETNVAPAPNQAVASTGAPAASPTSAAKPSANQATEPAKADHADEPTRNVDGNASPGEDGAKDGLGTKEEAQ